MDNIIRIFADGGCRGNQNKENVGGYGVLIEYNGNSKELKGSERNTTNNKMELKACIEGLKAIKNKSIKTVVISDSQYAVKGINEWVDGWFKKGWRTASKKPVENQELWNEFLVLKNQFTDIEFIHCKGHGTVVGNIRADELANIAMDECV